ncbi:sensor histidine kinase [Sphingomonas prati]|nr:sensor histidine kinase [Sphingomonas prati]
MTNDPSFNTIPTCLPQDPGTKPGNIRAALTALREEIAARDLRDAETARHHAQVLSELQHRVRNTAALVRAVFETTIATAENLEEVERHFCGRLSVLLRYQLPRSLGSRGDVDLEQLLRDELQQFDFGSAPGITIAGPAVNLPLEQAQPFGLAIHELVTNALKFGALATDGAKLKIRWVMSGQRLDLTWSESGVMGLSEEPLHKGFGREFIEDGLPYQIGAETSFVLRPDGIVCRIAWPIDARAG